MEEEKANQRVVVITGGNSGIGKAIATNFVRQKATVVIVGRDEEKGNRVVKELQTQFPDTPSCQFYPIDVSQTNAIEEGFKQITNEVGEITTLVNNAGITRDNLLIRMDEEEWDQVIAINLKSVYNTCRVVVPSMIRKKHGVIVNVSSVVALRGNAGQVNYAAAKAGMVGFTKSLARELGKRGIRVNCIAPGFIETQMTEKLTEKQRSALKDHIPMQRFGDPKHIAGLATFLDSEAAEFITGQVIAVDGGMGI